MSVEGSFTSSERTSKGSTVAATPRSSSDTPSSSAPFQRTSTPSVSPRAARKRSVLPSNVADSTGDEDSAGKRVESPSTWSAGARRPHAVSRTSALAKQQLTRRDELMTRSSQRLEHPRQGVERPGLTFVHEDDVPRHHRAIDEPLRNRRRALGRPIAGVVRPEHRRVAGGDGRDGGAERDRAVRRAHEGAPPVVARQEAARLLELEAERMPRQLRKPPVRVAVTGDLVPF